MQRLTTKIKPIAASICLVMALTACQTTDSNQPASDRLYAQIGEMSGIKRIVEDFINELLQDKRVAHHFNDADLDNFHDKLVEQICQISAGPCQYTGKAMDKIHADLKIDQAQFNAVAEALMAAMDNNEVPATVQNRLLALLVPMHKDIVTR